jgi:hypothetical protein
MRGGGGLWHTCPGRQQTSGCASGHRADPPRAGGHSAPSTWRPGRGAGPRLALTSLASYDHGRFRGRRAARDGLGSGRNRQTGGGSSSASDGSARVMSCPKARRATPVATRPQSVAIPRSIAGTSQCSRRPRPSPHPEIPPRRSPNTVMQLSIAGLALSLAVVLPSGSVWDPLPGSIPDASAPSRVTHGTAGARPCVVASLVLCYP